MALPSASRFSVGAVRIGELGRRAGVSTRTLRHYEDLGLMPARRRANGYREYDEQDVVVVAEITQNGVVTAEAKSAFERATARDGRNMKARFYLGVAAQQDGDNAKATSIWREMLTDAGPG